ncbi:MAG: F0F1 ATP synthase subunit alpha [Anaerolineaceae bacterium]|nr:F0F1 ATP synthase subunit alpha [Anaerolineaceae bacterium]MDD4043630.1 F0F1 ATP synthase subunit alpha [Anaerolineaceae bacterium]MDD4577597.1 F0F1 ATP synthase subunit alpha [Anaerolineaceae bacterium]
MTDLDLAAQTRLSELAGRLKETDPLAIDTDLFIDEVKSKVRDQLKPKPKSLSTDYVIKELQSVSGEHKHRVVIRSVGTVQHIGNGIATMSGLPMVYLEELVTFPNGVQGMVLNLDRDHVDVILLGPDMGIRGGDLAEATGRRLSIPVGMPFLGRVVDSLGRPLDDNRPIIPSEFRYVERIAPGVIARAPVDTPLYTGTKIIDALLPLGRGQRELIVGDRQIGKTTLAIDAILSQKGTDVKCIYVSIGQKKSSVLNAIETLKAGGVMNQTTVIVSSPDDPPALRYLAPYAGVTLAEFFLDLGMDVLIVYDDLSKHADTYREMSLLLRRPPGREAYPGDIFYLHSRLLERACRLNEENGGGSITALPIATTQRGDISSYIVTNLISITDGQIVLDADEFNKGSKPAIDIGASVSRVGSAAQEPAMKSVVGALKLELSQYEEVARFARFGTEVNEATQRQIDRGQRVEAVLQQGPHQPVRMEDQVILFYALTHGFMDSISPADISRFSKEMLNYIHNHAAQSVDQIRYRRELNHETKDELNREFTDFISFWEKKVKRTS